MKAMALVPAAVAAILALNISAASSQAACGKEYQACMDTCATRAIKSTQDSCFQSCEGKNNFCAEKIYGKRPAPGTPTVATAPKEPARDAMAKTEAAPDQAKDVAPAKDAAPAEQPLEPAKAADAEKAKAPAKQAADEPKSRKRGRH